MNANDKEAVVNDSIIKEEMRGSAHELVPMHRTTFTKEVLERLRVLTVQEIIS